MSRDVITYGPATLHALERDLDQHGEWSALTMQSRLRTLARNLRDAAGCVLAWRLHRDFARSWEHGDCEAWCPNLDGERAPGWER